jgi:hypothetical protein
MKYGEFAGQAEELVFSSDFRDLSAILDFPEPNIWQMLGISRKEILITKFLAWLLDPRSKHSFGDELLKRFIMEALRVDRGKRSDLTPVEIAVKDLSDTEVSAEQWLGRRRCDILAFSEKERLVCIVENKIGAKESTDQTLDYYRLSFVHFSLERYPNRVYIYLSPEGDLPQCESFIPLSYRAVLDLIKDTQIGLSMTETESFLLRQFQESVFRSVAVDQKTVDLARSIYDSHKDVLEFIYKYAERSAGEYEDSDPPVWDGISWFFNIGEPEYSWDDCREYSFVCAGSAKRYRRWMEEFEPGHVLYAYVSGSGYVGVGTITKPAMPFREATLEDGTRFVDLTLAGTYNDSDDEDISDWVACIKWESKVGKDKAVRSKPIVPATKSRVYEHNKNFVSEIREELRKRTGVIADE